MKLEEDPPPQGWVLYLIGEGIAKVLLDGREISWFAQARNGPRSLGEQETNL